MSAYQHCCEWVSLNFNSQCLCILSINAIGKDMNLHFPVFYSIANSLNKFLITVWSWWVTERKMKKQSTYPITYGTWPVISIWLTNVFWESSAAMMPTEAAAISEISHVAWFSKMACLYKAKRPQLPYNVPTAGGRWIHVFIQGH